MKELNFNFALKDLSGNEIPDSNAGKLLASLLSNDNGKNPAKFWAWAQEFYGGQTVKIDNQDLDLLKTLVTDSQQLTALSKAQILEVINK